MFSSPATDDFGAAFRLKEWWTIFKANVGGFMLAYLLVFAVSMVLNSILGFLYCTIILCCIVPFLTAPVTLYTVIISGALFGEAYREGVEKAEHNVIDAPANNTNQVEG